MPPKVEPMAVPDEKVVELRQLFFEKLEREGSKIPGGLHPDDLSRIRNRKKWLVRFLEYNDLNLKTSLDQLWKTVEWRKENNVNDTNEKCIHLDLIKAGLMFHRNEDVDGKRLLIFNTKMYVRGTHKIDDMKKNLIYYVERMYRETDMDQITAVFDMQDSGMSNVDLEYTRYIINLFKHYYPNSLNFILVFELPWVLTATFKIIKGLLPPKAVERLRFVSKKNIDEYIARDKMLTSWGGTDNYKFEFTFQDPTVTILARDPEDDNNNDYNSVQANRNGIGSRKVHFAPTNNMSPIESPMSDQPPSQFKDDKRLQVVEEGIIFRRKGPDAQGSVHVKNVSAETIMFKVKTTSPEKFRVSPPAGLIQPGQLERITVTMVHGHEEGSARDKFLIMCKPLAEDEASEEFVPIDRIHKEFKQADGNDIEQHRVRCIYSTGEAEAVHMASLEGEIVRPGSRNGTTTMKFSTADSWKSIEIVDLYNTVQRLERQVNRIQTLQFALLALCFLLIALIVIYVPKIESVNLAEGEPAAAMNEHNTLPI